MRKAPLLPVCAFPRGGLSLVIHVDADDERTDASANSSVRVACDKIIPAS